ncbi:MAG: VOC family protein [Cellvibrionaceae bacterium]
MEFNQPVPELPVADVEQAQEYYRDHFACKIEWIDPSKEIGAVSNDSTAIFFRKKESSFEPAVNWVYCSDVDKTYKELLSQKAIITESIDDKPWGIRQFTVHDLYGNIFYFFHG